MPVDERQSLAGLKEKIAARLAVKPQVFIVHSAELRLLRSLSHHKLLRFAEENGWSVVRRLGGRQIEFYNNAGASANF
jgi:hypothetical protein